MPRMQRGFSLVELLAVIGVLSALAAMLLPSVEASIESARQVACLNAQRQVGSAFQCYANDYRNHLIPQWRGITPALYPSWYAQAQAYLGGTELFYACSTPKDAATHACRGMYYGYNYRNLGMVTVGVASIVRLSQVAHPEATICIADSRGDADGWNSQFIENLYYYPSIAYGVSIGTWCAMTDDRHAGNTGILYVDGHGGMVPWDTVNRSGALWDRR